ncbi:GNAT family N-acetyltransferase [Veronia nyctiphanis]|uniref:GNAT family N-acetyltransferase n=1 Tax=Veronia nyctiphanis TaxID=1278244 RepID=A0A4Q0YQM2_9GAMM|nr:GNAT family N-acetyltransferase [Veronia nyctiphanis]RXJ72853.1 GNAT family N-acetyltransferase [Veronia nyctiphanis]
MKLHFENVASTEQIHQVFELANIIWTEHYTPIIGADQVEYMLGHFHSKEVITDEVTTGLTHYFLMVSDDKPVGYLGVKLSEDDLFLSKIYLLSSERGNGFGRKAIDFIKDMAKEYHKKSIVLTVNKYNTNTIKAYQACGFDIVEEICADIGRGYVMDDYRMRLIV